MTPEQLEAVGVGVAALFLPRLASMFVKWPVVVQLAVAATVAAAWINRKKKQPEQKQTTPTPVKKTMSHRRSVRRSVVLDEEASDEEPPAAASSSAEQQRKAQAATTGAEVISALKGSRVPEALAERLGAIVDIVVRDYVSNWYGNISNEGAFVHDARVCLSEVIGELGARLLTRLNIVDFALDTAADALTLQLRAHGEARGGETNLAEASYDSHTLGNLSDVVTAANRRNAATVKRLAANGRLHPAFSWPESPAGRRDDVPSNRGLTPPEERYLRHVAARLVKVLAPSEERQCHAARHLLRELMAQVVLTPILNAIQPSNVVNWLQSGVALLERKRGQKTPASTNTAPSQPRRSKSSNDVLGSFPEETVWRAGVAPAGFKEANEDTAWRSFAGAMDWRLAKEKLVAAGEGAYLYRLEPRSSEPRAANEACEIVLCYNVDGGQICDVVLYGDPATGFEYLRFGGGHRDARLVDRAGELSEAPPCPTLRAFLAAHLSDVALLGLDFSQHLSSDSTPFVGHLEEEEEEEAERGRTPMPHEVSASKKSEEEATAALFQEQSRHCVLIELQAAVEAAEDKSNWLGEARVAKLEERQAQPGAPSAYTIQSSKQLSESFESLVVGTKKIQQRRDLAMAAELDEMTRATWRDGDGAKCVHRLVLALDEVLSHGGPCPGKPARYAAYVAEAVRSASVDGRPAAAQRARVSVEEVSVVDIDDDDDDEDSARAAGLAWLVCALRLGATHGALREAVADAKTTRRYYSPESVVRDPSDAARLLWLAERIDALGVHPPVQTLKAHAPKLYARCSILNDADPQQYLANLNQKPKKKKTTTMTSLSNSLLQFPSSIMLPSSMLSSSSSSSSRPSSSTFSTSSAALPVDEMSTSSHSQPALTTQAASPVAAPVRTTRTEDAAAQRRKKKRRKKKQKSKKKKAALASSEVVDVVAANRRRQARADLLCNAQFQSPWKTAALRLNYLLRTRFTRRQLRGQLCPLTKPALYAQISRARTAKVKLEPRVKAQLNATTSTNGATYYEVWLLAPSDHQHMDRLAKARFLHMGDQPAPQQPLYHHQQHEHMAPVVVALSSTPFARRRYRDFRTLRLNLVAALGPASRGMLPPLPPRRVAERLLLYTRRLEERRAGLEAFVTAILRVPTLRDSHEFRRFVSRHKHIRYTDAVVKDTDEDQKEAGSEDDSSDEGDSDEELEKEEDSDDYDEEDDSDSDSESGSDSDDSEEEDSEEEDDSEEEEEEQAASQDVGLSAEDRVAPPQRKKKKIPSSSSSASLKPSETALPRKEPAAASPAAADGRQPTAADWRRLKRVEHRSYSLLRELFDVERMGMMRRNFVSLLRTGARAMLSPSLAVWLGDTARREKRVALLAHLTHKLTDFVWRDGLPRQRRPEDPLAASRNVLAATDLRSRLVDAIPSSLTSLVGTKAVDDATAKLHELLLCPIQLRSLTYTLLDLVLLEICPELQLHVGGLDHLLS